MAWSIFTNGGGSLAAVGWAQQLLRYLNAPVTPGNVEFIYQWEKSEGGGGQYNPLNTGPLKGHTNLLVPGDTGSHFGGGAADYNSWTSGLMGAMYGIQLPAYKNVLNNLRSNNPAAARQALWDSPWAASHYGHGANWYFGTIPNGTPILPSGGGSGGSTSSGGTTEVLIPGGDPCAWNLDIPVAGSFCVITKVGVRDIFAIGIGLVGVITGLVGAILLVSYGLKPFASRAEQVAGFVPGAGMALRAAKATPGRVGKATPDVSPAAKRRAVPAG